MVEEEEMEWRREPWKIEGMNGRKILERRKEGQMNEWKEHGRNGRKQTPASASAESTATAMKTRKRNDRRTPQRKHNSAPK